MHGATRASPAGAAQAPTVHSGQCDGFRFHLRAVAAWQGSVSCQTVCAILIIVPEVGLGRFCVCRDRRHLDGYGYHAVDNCVRDNEPRVRRRELRRGFRKMRRFRVTRTELSLMTRMEAQCFFMLIYVDDPSHLGDGVWDWPLAAY